IWRRACQIDRSLTRRPVATLPALQQLHKELDRSIDRHAQLLEGDCQFHNLVDAKLQARGGFRRGTVWAFGSLEQSGSHLEIREFFNQDFATGRFCKTDAQDVKVSEGQPRG